MDRSGPRAWPYHIGEILPTTPNICRKGPKRKATKSNKAEVIIKRQYLPTYLHTCIHACIHTCEIEIGSKQAVIGSLPFWGLLAFFTYRWGADESADIKRPSSQASIVCLWPLSMCQGIAYFQVPHSWPYCAAYGRVLIK